MNETYKIRALGGALVVTIPQQIARVVGLNKGDEVRFGIVNTGSGGTVTIDRVKKAAKGKSK